MSDNKALAIVREAKATALSIGEVKEMAQAVSASGLFPAARTPEAAFTLMMLCQAEGLHPMQALRRYHIIEGQPAMKADAILAEYQARGGRVKWIKTDETSCEAVFSHPSSGDVPVRWSIEDAKRANLAGKKNWTTYPRQMLRARVISEGVRMSLPEVVVGIYTPEEVMDFRTEASAPSPVPHNPNTGEVIEGEVVEPRASMGQIKALAAALGDLGFTSTDRDGRIAWCRERVGREIASSKDLTTAECSHLIDAAKAAKPAERAPGAEG